MEIWKDIKGYEGLYQISNIGRVKSLDYRGFKRIKILKIQICKKKGYCRIILTKDKKLKAYLVHRLVAIAFIKNPKNKKQVDHIDNIKHNNNVENLQWVDNKENNELRYKRDGYVVTEKQRTAALNNKYQCKRVFKKDKLGNILCYYDSLKECAEDNNINKTMLSQHCKYNRNLKGDYIYSYDENI